MPLYCLAGQSPVLKESVWIAPGAHVIGEVHLGENCSVWYNAVIRADHGLMQIGARTNIQDNAVLHADDGFPLVVGEGVTIGHQSMVHGCQIGDNCLIGIGAIILNGAVIGDNCIVGAGALVGENRVIEPGHLVVGTPARTLRMVSEQEIQALKLSATHYVGNAKRFSQDCVRAEEIK